VSGVSAPRRRLGLRLFLITTVISFLLSVSLWFLGFREEGLFVGLWVPSILAAGIFWMLANSAAEPE
jgi:predicted secreted protein